MHIAPPTTKLEDFAGTLMSAMEGNPKDFAATRRGLILTPLLAALPVALLADPAHAIDPAETQVTLPDQYQWKPALPNAPAQSVETVPVFGATDKPGPYVVLIKWHPGYMSAPHNTLPTGYALSSPAPGGSIRARISSRRRPFQYPRAASCAASRTRRTMTGVKKGGKEPAVIGIFGQAPIEFKLTDPTKPLVREV